MHITKSGASPRRSPHGGSKASKSRGYGLPSPRPVSARRFWLSRILNDTPRRGD